MTTKTHHQELEAIREDIRTLADSSPYSLSQISENFLGRNKTYLQQYITKSVPKLIKGIERSHLARALNVPEERFMTSQEIEASHYSDIPRPTSYGFPQSLNDSAPITSNAKPLDQYVFEPPKIGVATITISSDKPWTLEMKEKLAEYIETIVRLAPDDEGKHEQK